MRKRFLSALLLLHLISGPVMAEPARLTLEDALSEAMTHNLQMRSQQARLDVARAEVVTAGTRLNPYILSDNGIAERTFRLGIQQTFHPGGKRHRRIDLAKARLKETEAEVDTEIVDLRAAVRHAYSGLYIAEARQRCYEDALRDLRQLMAIARRKSRMRDTDALDADQAEIAEIETGSLIQDAISRKREARNILNNLLGKPLGTEWQLVSPDTGAALLGTFPLDAMQPAKASPGNGSSPEDALVREAWHHRPELRANSSGVEVAGRELSLARTEIIPDITLSAGPDLVTGEGGFLSAFIMGTVELPVFDRQQGPMQEAKARKTRKELEQAALKARIALEVSNAYTRLLQKRKQMETYETALLPKAMQLSSKAKQKFEAGTTGLPIAFFTRQSYRDTQLEALQAITDYQDAVSDLERAVGTFP